MMSINRGNQRYQDKILIWVICFVLMSSIIMDRILALNVELEKRYQARQNLNQISYCVRSIHNQTNGEGVFDLQKIYNTCTAHSKTSFTGDVYILDASTKEFAYENSRDIPSKPVFFTKEYIGETFYDWESGEKALNIMLLGKDSERGVNLQYYFNEEPEWLEWKYVHLGNTDLVIVQGTQSAEVMQQYLPYRLTGLAISFLTSILLLIFMACSVRRRLDDRGNN